MLRFDTSKYYTLSKQKARFKNRALQNLLIISDLIRHMYLASPALQASEHLPDHRVFAASVNLRG